MDGFMIVIRNAMHDLSPSPPPLTHTLTVRKTDYIRRPFRNRTDMSRTLSQEKVLFAKQVSAWTFRRRFLQQPWLSALRPRLRLPFRLHHRQERFQWGDMNNDESRRRNGFTSFYQTNTGCVNSISWPHPYGCTSWTAVVRIADSLNSSLYVSQVLQHIALPYLWGLFNSTISAEKFTPECCPYCSHVPWCSTCLTVALAGAFSSFL